MLKFHRNLQRVSKVKALQQASLAVMKNPEYRHPFYCSGFVLMGEGFLALQSRAKHGFASVHSHYR